MTEAIAAILAKRTTYGAGIGVALVVAFIWAAVTQAGIDLDKHFCEVICIVGALAALPAISQIAKDWAAGGHAPSARDAAELHAIRVDAEKRKADAEVDAARRAVAEAMEQRSGS